LLIYKVQEDYTKKKKIVKIRNIEKNEKIQKIGKMGMIIKILTIVGEFRQDITVPKTKKTLKKVP
jgi:hypothetical protein